MNHAPAPAENVLQGPEAWMLDDPRISEYAGSPAWPRLLALAQTAISDYSPSARCDEMVLRTMVGLEIEELKRADMFARKIIGA